MAVGACGQTPVMPNLPGRLDFQGLVLHSADYKSPEAWKGKAGVVVGTANTAHDVAQDMVEGKLPSVTMVQRARTFVVPVENYKYFSDFSYNTTIPTSEADFESMSTPYAVARLIASTALAAMAKQDPARFDALEAAGFRVERYGDIWYHLCERGGGHYVDVGCSKMISDGAVSHGQHLLRCPPDSTNRCDPQPDQDEVRCYNDPFHPNRPRLQRRNRAPGRRYCLLHRLHRRCKGRRGQNLWRESSVQHLELLGIG